MCSFNRKPQVRLHEHHRTLGACGLRLNESRPKSIDCNKATLNKSVHSGGEGTNDNRIALPKRQLPPSLYSMNSTTAPSVA